jgi:GGDEF domain-containing protein
VKTNDPSRGHRAIATLIALVIGIALYPADALGAGALVKAADAAMYGAKRPGCGFLPWAA